MPRENSFSDSDGRSLTPDLEDEVAAPSSPLPPVDTTHNSRPSIQVINATYSAPADIPTNADAKPKQNPSIAAQDSSQRPQFATPTDRFRATGHRCRAGVDPRRASAFLSFGHISQQCLIEVADYSTMRSSFGRMTNHELIKLLSDPRASEREPALALKYDMHPLSLEDVLHQRGHPRSKADYYPKHLFLRVLCHTVSTDDNTSTPNSSISHLPRSESPVPMDGDDDDDDVVRESYEFDEKTVLGSASASRFSTKRGTLKHRVSSTVRDVEHGNPVPGRLDRFAGLSMDENKTKNAENRKLIRELKKGERVNVKIQPMCIFLFRDGTVLSIHRDSKLDLTAPITERLRQRDTGLRKTADPSLLVQSLLDLVVDQALEVVEEYQGRILKIEQEVLLKPSVKTVRRLHILQGDLILHKRTLEPLKTVIYGLRRYDVDRTAALLEKVDPTMKLEGYMSHKSKIYLADVHDHMEYILTSLDMIAGITDNLINYTFNMASYQMNEVMRRLTLVTIICLPLTLLTGYFGMNFEFMWSVKFHSDVLFWEIAIPVMAIVISLFLFSDLQRMKHYVEKRLIRRKVKKSYKPFRAVCGFFSFSVIVGYNSLVSNGPGMP
ncbi:Magnesium transport protein CorA [Grifola frondosa]|uniref:Magnesium transport protein CorA n=1 Tax=Grifola frondosa TaxID=5627 RepID=A0A1C7LV34_GRIFR|nr:Magnesium transport protein CorA [Grifola frondosa]